MLFSKADDYGLSLWSKVKSYFVPVYYFTFVNSDHEHIFLYYRREFGLTSYKLYMKHQATVDIIFSGYYYKELFVDCIIFDLEQQHNKFFKGV